jgi:hypothetical protein
VPCLERGNASLSDVFRSIEVCVFSVTTAQAKEVRSTPIFFLTVPTGTARLRRVPWINFDDLYPKCFALVGQKSLKLAKAPGIQSLVEFFASLFSSSNIRQVFQDVDFDAWISSQFFA